MPSMTTLGCIVIQCAICWAGYEIPKLCNPSKTLATEIFKDERELIMFKVRQQHNPKGVGSIGGVRQPTTCHWMVKARPNTRKTCGIRQTNSLAQFGPEALENCSNPSM